MKTILDDRRVLLPVLLTALAIAVGAVLIVMLSGGASGGATAATSSSSGPPAESGSHAIDITNFEFAPANVTVKRGARISWVNHDAAPHTATATAAAGFDTGTLKKGDKKTLTLSKPGTYAYICSFHPFMKATVIVR